MKKIKHYEKLIMKPQLIKKEPKKELIGNVVVSMNITIN